MLAICNHVTSVDVRVLCICKLMAIAQLPWLYFRIGDCDALEPTFILLLLLTFTPQ